MNTKIEFLGTEQLNKFFNEIKSEKLKIGILTRAFRKAGKNLNAEAEKNIRPHLRERVTRKKGGKYKRSNFYKSFKVKQPDKNKAEIYAGVGSSLAHLFEDGTQIRSYTTKKNKVSHNTGRINATHFFKRAFDTTKSENAEIISNSVVKDMERLYKKYTGNKVKF